jgi:hypothetical protein
VGQLLLPATGRRTYFAVLTEARYLKACCKPWRCRLG